MHGYWPSKMNMLMLVQQADGCEKQPSAFLPELRVAV